MDAAAKKLLKIQEILMDDPEYQNLYWEYQQRNADFLAVVAQLQPEQQRMIYDYLGVCIEMHTQMLLLACR